MQQTFPPTRAKQSAAGPGVTTWLEDHPLSVLAVTPEFHNGGTEIQLLELGRGLTSRGDRYRIVTGRGTQLDTLRTSGISHRVVRQTAGAVPMLVELLAYAGAILRELLIEPADVIQSTSIRTTYAATLAVAAFGLRRPRTPEPVIVTTLHGGKQSDLYGRAARHLRYLGDAVIVVSSDGRDALQGRGFPEERLSVIPPGRDLVEFIAVRGGKVEPAEITGIPADARIVLHVGRLAPLKGLTYLLDAWGLICSDFTATHLVIVGTGELEADLRAHAASHGIGERVSFLGFRRDVPALLARADAFVLSSLWEGMPMAAVEAMAAGVPVVATHVGGTADAVEDQVTGMLVPPADPGALASALRTLLTDRTRAQQLAETAHLRVRRRFSRDAMVAATRQVYLETRNRHFARAAQMMPLEL